MTIKIICAGKIKERYFSDAVNEYKKRLSRFVQLEINEIADEKAAEQLSDAEKEQIKIKEGRRILSKVDDGATLIAMAIDGKQLSSSEFSKEISRLMGEGKSKICFAIGGSLGLSNEVLSRADYKLSFSKLTFPHQLFRVILLEQIYRAFKIMNNEPYHK